MIRRILALFIGALDDARHQAAERDYWTEQLATGRRLNLITGVSAFIAAIALFFVGLTYEGSKEATVEANRAWIVQAGLKMETMLPLKDDEYVVRYVLTYGNTGRAPGLDVSHGFTFNLIDPADSDFSRIDWDLLMLPKNSACSTIEGKLSGPTAVASQVASYEFRFRAQASKDAISNIQNHKAVLVIQSCIKYKEIIPWTYVNR